MWLTQVDRESLDQTPARCVRNHILRPCPAKGALHSPNQRLRCATLRLFSTISYRLGMYGCKTPNLTKRPLF